MSGLSTSTIYKTLRKKDIKINGKRISDNCSLKTGDVLEIYIADNLLEKKIDIPIVYEDENIVVFNKPQNIESTGENSLASYAKKIYQNSSNTFIEPCHRLDRNTSGLVLFARNNECLNIILNAFKKHLIEKHYVCAVYGIPTKKAERLEAYLFKDAKKSTVFICDEPKKGYQKIITSYKILKVNTQKNISMLDVQIETGRTHQIRAHMAHIHLPIIGDGKYGFNKINKQFNIQNQALISYSLKFKFDNDNILSYLNGKIIKLSNVTFPFI